MARKVSRVAFGLAAGAALAAGVVSVVYGILSALAARAADVEALGWRSSAWLVAALFLAAVAVFEGVRAHGAPAPARRRARFQGFDVRAEADLTAFFARVEAARREVEADRDAMSVEARARRLLERGDLVEACAVIERADWADALEADATAVGVSWR